MTVPSYLRRRRSVLERVSRERAQTVRVADNTLLCRVLGKYKVYCDAEDIGITPHLALDGCWEAWLTRVMARTVQPGWYCIDVGANHGYYTAIMADAVGPMGRVLAVEPHPRTAALLRLTLDVNGFHQYASLLEKVVHDTDDNTVHLVIPRNRGLNATLYRTPIESDEVVEVETVTVDSLTRDWWRLNLIKIDAEGAEEAVWRGMQHTLARNPDITVIMEINCGRYADPERFLRDIQQAGFPLRYVDVDARIRAITIDKLQANRFEDRTLFLRKS